MSIETMEGHEKQASGEIAMTLKSIDLTSWIKIYFTVVLFTHRH